MHSIKAAAKKGDKRPRMPGDPDGEVAYKRCRIQLRLPAMHWRITQKAASGPQKERKREWNATTSKEDELGKTKTFTHCCRWSDHFYAVGIHADAHIAYVCL